ncbi:unnamed protein product [Cuscuta campestris]|uniref:Uncharacterized protein n=1 Tax=Cuscuta campestris TaxID=132261 RepID=A0A484MCK1_9ASTE|nr:unnamed protein product [Cuscuta campestris]
MLKRKRTAVATLLEQEMGTDLWTAAQTCRRPPSRSHHWKLTKLGEGYVYHSRWIWWSDTNTRINGSHSLLPSPSPWHHQGYSPSELTSTITTTTNTKH